ncbi:uncharacterized protein LOC135950549 [Calliphora vicina]|uniref:uncharacterized protein LOC135950549 n=1 Tax=Calliphora vicina TaxID=7373 RepID=UPI00325B87D7
MDRGEILGLSVNALKAKLTELELDTQGLKDDLRRRLLGHYGMDFTHLNEEDGACAGGSPDDDKDGRDFPMHKSMYTLKDVEGSLSQFSGTSTPDVIQWLNEVEEMGTILKWSSLQMYVYGKQLLEGAAKTFIKSQRGICDWHSLKATLKEEFGERFSAAEVNRQIRNRRLNKSESLIEYLYSIMELGAQIDLDEKSVVEFFIEGIPDSKFNKTVLYQAETIGELKKQIKVYEKTRSFPKSSYKGKDAVATEKKADNSKVDIDGKEKRCFKCGGKSHLARDCPEKQTKCFKCRGFGHRSFECPVKKTDNKTKSEGDQANMVRKGPGLLFKDITIRGKTLSALFDTGCDLCLVRVDMLFVMGEVDFMPERVTLYGVGDSEIVTMGRFDEVVRIDDLDFEVRFYVVGERDILHSIMLGNSLIRKAEITITEGEVIFKKAAERNLLLEEFSGICLNLDEYKPSTEVNIDHLNRSFKTKVIQAITEYKPQMNVQSPVKMNIVLKDDLPVYQRPRRLPFADQKVVDQQVSDWLTDGIVQASTSEYASPIVLVSKKDGSKRLCCDYRKLNQKIVRDNFPMPLMDDVLDKLQGANFYTTLDLRNGFFHVPLEKSSRKYTAFLTHNGQYEFLFVPFGISNSPAVFTRFLSAVFKDLIRNGTAIVYMDDIIIPSKDMIEGLEKFMVVLERAASNGLQIKWEKCQILQSSVKFLGYIIKNGSIKPAVEKIRVVKDFPIPTDQKMMQRFLGLTSYFRRY